MTYYADSRVISSLHGLSVVNIASNGPTKGPMYCISEALWGPYVYCYWGNDRTGYCSDFFGAPDSPGSTRRRRISRVSSYSSVTHSRSSTPTRPSSTRLVVHADFEICQDDSRRGIVQCIYLHLKHALCHRHSISGILPIGPPSPTACASFTMTRLLREYGHGNTRRKPKIRRCKEP